MALRRADGVVPRQPPAPAEALSTGLACLRARPLFPAAVDARPTPAGDAQVGRAFTHTQFQLFDKQTGAARRGGRARP